MTTYIKIISNEYDTLEKLMLITLNKSAETNKGDKANKGAETNKSDEINKADEINKVSYAIQCYTCNYDPEYNGVSYEEYESDFHGKHKIGYSTKPIQMSFGKALEDTYDHVMNLDITSIKILAPGKNLEFYGEKLDEGRTEAAEIIANTLQPVGKIIQNMVDEANKGGQGPKK